MSFRLLSKSVTLNVLERRIVAVIFVISAKSVAFGAHCVKVVQDIPKLSAQECSPKHLVFLAIYHLR